MTKEKIMKSYVVNLILLLISTITSTQCQVNNETSHFEIGQKFDDDSSGYTVIGNRTDLRINSTIELRYVALDSPVSFMEMHVNANVKTFQFIYLNESSCIIRFIGLNSSNPLVTAEAKLHHPNFSFNENTERYEYVIVNETMVLQMVKEVEGVSETTTTTNERVYGYHQSKVITQQTNMLHYSEYNDFNNFCDTCGSSALKKSMLLLCSIMLINFTNIF